MGPARIVKLYRITAGQDNLTHSLCITASIFEKVTQMKRAQLIFIRSDNCVVAHGHQ